jgi:hypothetical protein
MSARRLCHSKKKNRFFAPAHTCPVPQKHATHHIYKKQLPPDIQEKIPFLSAVLILDSPKRLQFPTNSTEISYCS